MIDLVRVVKDGGSGGREREAAHPDAAHPDAAHPDAAHPDAAHRDATHLDATPGDATHRDARGLMARCFSSRLVRGVVGSVCVSGVVLGFVGCGDEFTCGDPLACSHEGAGGSSAMSSGGVNGGGNSSTSGGSSEAGAGVGAGGKWNANGGASGSGDESGDAGAGGAGNGGNAGAGGTDSTPVTCDTLGSPSENPCIVSDAHALFVAPTGSDSADGSREAPLKTITKALARALAAPGSTLPDKVVIVCNATYDEAVALHGGVRLYGGFACPDSVTPWSYEASHATRVAPHAFRPALEVRGVESAVTIEDFEFDAADASGVAASSIAAVIADSPNVVLRRTRIVAGKGTAGADGASGSNGADGALVGAAQKGANAACSPGPKEASPGGVWPESASVCGSLGGKGGDGPQATLGEPGAAGTPLENVSPPNTQNGGLGRTVDDPLAPGGNGKQGSPGDPGGAGARATQEGTFSAAGYTPAIAGGSGTAGFPGQGGGGGGGSSAFGLDVGCIGAGGGAGGMGGCGGKPGTGGSSGGASVALLVWNSGVTLDGCSLNAGDGGDGGKGGNGGLGGLGRAGASGGAEGIYVGGTQVAVCKGGDGGPGGNGGAGGPGAGGNGGPSYALVYSGPAPLNQQSVLLPGKGGKGGAAGTTKDVHGVAGSDGQAAESWPALRETSMP